MRILLTGGGTGGHLIPLLSVVEEIRKRDPEAEFLFVGPRSEFNESIRAAGIEVREVRAGKFRRYFSLKNLSDVVNVLVGTDEAFFHIFRFRPDVIFSKGGFASVPVVLAASYTRIPVLTHESDTVPGLANKIIGKFAKKIFIAFPMTRRYFPDSKIIESGNPVRGDIADGSRSRARDMFGLRDELPVVLVFGGSQGAQKINEAVLRSLEELLQKFQIIHICGTNNFEEVKKKVAALDTPDKNRYRVYPYLREEMKEAFALADYVISRAGASSLSEIAALRKPALIIPLPSAANNHQYHNAKYFADEGMIMMVEEKDLGGDALAKKMDELQNKRGEIVANLKEYNDARGGKTPAEIIAEEILECGKDKK